MAAWLGRELRALLLEADVELWRQQLLGALRGCGRGGGVAPAAAAGTGNTAGTGSGEGPAASGAAVVRPVVIAPARLGAGRGPQRPPPQQQQAQRGDGSSRFSGYLEEQVCVPRLEAAARPLLADHAPRFARELWGFVQSGLTVPGHDAAVFGTRGRAAKRRRGAAAGVSADGSDGAAGSGDASDSGGGSEGRGGDQGDEGEDDDEDDDDPGGRVWAAFGEDLAAGSDY